MNNFRIVQYKYPDIPIDSWEELSTKVGAGHFLQSYLWAKLRKKIWNTDPFFLLFTENKTPVGFLLFFQESFKNQFLAQHPPLDFLIPAIKRVYPVISWNFGPVFTAKEQEERYFSDVLDYMDDFANRNTGFKKNILASSPLFSFTAPEEYKAYFLKKGYKSIPQETFYIDLTSGPEAIWKKFKSSVRKNVGRCIKDGVAIRTLNGKDEYKQFYDVYTAFRKERGLNIFSFADLLAHAQILKPKGSFEFFAASHNKHMIATLAVNIYNGIITEVLSANTPYCAESSLNPNDFLKWEVIKWGHSRGHRIYDLSGIEINPQPGSKEEGIRRFKSKFGGEAVSYYLYSKKL